MGFVAGEVEYGRCMTSKFCGSLGWFECFRVVTGMSVDVVNSV